MNTLYKVATLVFKGSASASRLRPILQHDTTELPQASLTNGYHQLSGDQASDELEVQPLLDGQHAQRVRLPHPGADPQELQCPHF